MGMTTAGRNFIAAAIMNDGPPAFFDNTNAHMGVGDSSTAFAISQTDLQASTNKNRQGMNSGYPSLATNVITFQATWGTGDGNFAWEEWGIFNAASGGTMLLREVESFGTKSSGDTWQLEIDITVAIGS